MEMQVMKCPRCGANIKLEKGKNTAVCEYCDSPIAFDFEVKDNSEAFKAEPEKKKAPKTAAKAVMDEDEADKIDAWRKKRRTWLIGIGVCFVLAGLISSDMGGFLFLFWIIVGGIYITTGKPGSLRKNISTKPQEEREYTCTEYPWYLKVPAIVIFGFMTGGIYWIVGAILRHELKK